MSVARLRTFVDGIAMTGMLDATWHAWLKACAFIRLGTSGDAYAGSSPGGVRRYGVIVNAIKPAANGNFRVIDTSVDWRDRLIRGSFAAVGGASANAMFPGANAEDKRFALGAAAPPHVLWWSGPGVALPQAAYTGRSMRITGTDGALVVRSSDGALCWEKFAVDAVSPQCLMILVEATERLGVSTSPPAYADPSGADTIPIQPRELNELQDAGMASQFRGNAPMADLIPVPTPSLSTAFPLGPVLMGPPPAIPILPYRVLTDGRDVGTSERMFEARQTVGATGLLRRWVKTGSLASGSHIVVDTTEDWRDRMIVAQARLGAAEVAPTAAGFGFTLTGFYGSTAYTGTGEDPAIAGGSPAYRARLVNGPGQDMSILARASDGALCVRNEGVGAGYLFGLVQCPFPVGTRSTP